MNIAVIASFAEDHLERDGIVSVLEGGPAYFIQETLRTLGVMPYVYSGSKPAIISIRLIDGVERGTLVEVQPIHLLEKIQADALIVSTVDCEFSLRDLPDGIGFTIVDLQGYLRSAEGIKKISDEKLWKKFSCVKVTEEEFEKLPVVLCEDQKQRELIVTCGSRDVTVWSSGIEYKIPVRPVLVKHALGAGDRFVAAYTVARCRADEPEKAARFAVEYVSTKLSNH